MNHELTRTPTNVMVTKRALRIWLPIPLIGVAAYCLNGFTSTFEPSAAETQLIWRVVYASGCIVCLSLLGILLAGSVRADADGRSAHRRARAQSR